MPEVVGAVVPPAQVAREEGPLLLKPRQQPAGLLEVSGVGDVLELVEGAGEPGHREDCKASPGEQQKACDRDCAEHASPPISILSGSLPPSGGGAQIG